MNRKLSIYLALILAGIISACQSADPSQLEAEAQQLINEGKKEKAKKHISIFFLYSTFVSYENSVKKL